MTSKQQQKRVALHEKLQQLRSATNSTATSTTAVLIDDASRYIEELMEKVEKLNLEIQSGSTASSSSNQPDPSTMHVAVEAVERGFMINVYSLTNHHGLLISLLDVFDDLGLDVLDATITCSESFHLEALGSKNKDRVGANISEEVIKAALLHAMKTWNQ